LEGHALDDALCLREEDNFFADPIWWELSDRELVKTSDESWYRPRLPEQKQQIGVFRRSVDKSEIEALKAEFP
jgi:alpha-N-acetylglucosamine transferase